jgi:hypothetical protein
MLKGITFLNPWVKKKAPDFLQEHLFQHHEKRIIPGFVGFSG